MSLVWTVSNWAEKAWSRSPEKIFNHDLEVPGIFTPAPRPAVSSFSGVWSPQMVLGRSLAWRLALYGVVPFEQR